MNPVQRAHQGFERTFGNAPDGVVFVPGRVNLIGEHVDYNDGLVLPMPISAGTAVAWQAIGAPELEAVALDLDHARDRFIVGADAPHHPADWRSYLRGTAAALADQIPASMGARLAIAGSIPRGSGLSSSASVCVAIGRALLAAAGLHATDPRRLAAAAQMAEHNWAGVHCGIMDQMAVAAGEPGKALLLDCANLATRQVPLPSDWAVMIVQSGVRRGLTDGHYNQRRRDCEIATRAMNLPSLRHASVELIENAGLDQVVAKRARHVVDEIARTRRAVAALDAGDIAAFGTELRASHRSLRDLFEVSVPAVDQLVAVLDHAIGDQGGARMTGGGFGGAVVAVMRAVEVPRVEAALRLGYTPPDQAVLELMIEAIDPLLNAKAY